MYTPPTTIYEHAAAAAAARKERHSAAETFFKIVKSHFCYKPTKFRRRLVALTFFIYCSKYTGLAPW
jgi:hypothetical protein